MNHSSTFDAESDGGDFDVNAFIAEVTETLARRLHLDDPTIAVRVLVDAAVGHWRRLGGDDAEIEGHLTVIGSGAQKKSRAELSPGEAGAEATGRNKATTAKDTDAAKTGSSLDQSSDRSGGQTDEETDEATSLGRSVGAGIASPPQKFARIDTDGLKVVAGAVSGMPYRLHLLGPGSAVVKTLSGRGRQQDLRMWLQTAMNHLPEGYGWRLIGPAGELVDSAQPGGR